MFDYYDISNILGSVIVPGAFHPLKNATAAYFVKYLLEKAISVFKWELPETWDKDYFLYILYLAGYIGVFETEEFGVIPQYGTLSGYNVFYAPRRFLYSNPLLKTGNLVIHEDCELIKLQGSYTGIADLVCYYASKFAMLSQDIDMNLVNTKLSKVFWGKDDATIASFKKAYDKFSSGNPAIFLDKELKETDEKGNHKTSWEIFCDDLKNNYLVPEMLSDFRKLENAFCNDLGIPNANTDKRERMITDEVNANNIETYTRAELWLERLKECVERVNKKYGLKISVDWRVKPNESNVVNSGLVEMGRNTI